MFVMRVYNMGKFQVLVFFVAVPLISVLWSAQCFAQGAASSVDWLDGAVTATGRGYANKTGGPMDVDNAIAAAKVVAQATLLEAIKGVMVDNQTAVSDVMTDITETKIKVQGVLRGAMLVGEPQIKEDKEFVVASVVMQVCLFSNGTGCNSSRPLVSALPKSRAKNGKKNEACNLMPNIMSTQEILSKVTYDTTEPLKLFIISMEGNQYNAEFNEFIIGYEEGKDQKCSVYSPDKVDPIVRRDRGIAETFFRVSDAERKYGSNIIIIMAKSVNSNNYILIDKKDAYLMNLLNERARNSLFNEAKIGISFSK